MKYVALFAQLVFSLHSNTEILFVKGPQIESRINPCIESRHKESFTQRHSLHSTCAEMLGAMSAFYPLLSTVQGLAVLISPVHYPPCENLLQHIKDINATASPQQQRSSAGIISTATPSLEESPR